MVSVSSKCEEARPSALFAEPPPPQTLGAGVRVVERSANRGGELRLPPLVILLVAEGFEPQEETLIKVVELCGAHLGELG